MNVKCEKEYTFLAIHCVYGTIVRYILDLDRLRLRRDENSLLMWKIYNAKAKRID